MILAVVALAVVCGTAFAAFVVITLSDMNKDLRKEVQKLTAALVSEENPVSAAIYQSHDPSKTTEDVLIERANERFNHKPLGM